MSDARPRAGEAGFGLIEVVVSAAILVTVTLGTLSLLDGSQDKTVESRGRMVAAQLAEQEQENLRGVRVSELAGTAATGRTGFTRTATKTVGNIAYTVTSRGDWLADASGTTPTCTDTGTAQYLRLTTTVNDVKDIDGVPPIIQTTLLTPKLGAFGDHTGTLGVKVVGRDGTTPVSGLVVTATSPVQTSTQTTNAAGCALFPYVPSGDYTATFSRTGYVDPQGRNPGTITGKVVDNALTVVTQRFDRAASIRATIKTGTLSSTSSGITVANSGIGTASGARTFPAAALASAHTAYGLFPFTTAYSVYSGTCTANAPSNYGGTTSAVTLGPGDANVAVTVTQPTLNVTVMRTTVAAGKSTTSAQRNATVKATSVDTASCGALSYSLGTTDTSGRASVGLPYGPYKVCVSSTPSGSSTPQYLTASATNDGATGSAGPTVTFTSSTGTTPC